MKFSADSDRTIKPEDAAAAFAALKKRLTTPGAGDEKELEVPLVPGEADAEPETDPTFRNLKPIDDEDPRIKHMKSRKDLDL